MKSRLPLVAVVSLAALSFSAATGRGQTTRPAGPPPPPAAAPDRRVMIVSIDGLRPDLMIRARTPYLRELTDRGSFSFWARTTPHAITLPSHVSMLTGVVPRRHEIEWNKDLPLKEPVYPSVPTLFELAKKAGYSTALAAGKSKFDAVARPGTVDHLYLPQSAKCDDADVARAAADMIANYRPQVMFVHLPGVDNAGHARGWGTPEQLAAVETADATLGGLLRALEAAGLREQTTLIVTADHGGAGRTHLADDPRSRHIPWIITGPGVRKNVDLTTHTDLVINTEDTFATACHVLGIAADKRIDGKPVLPAMEHGVAERELLVSDGSR
jgi:arylsulfatase A-like enzyme